MTLKHTTRTLDTSQIMWIHVFKVKLICTKTLNFASLIFVVTLFPRDFMKSRKLSFSKISNNIAYANESHYRTCCRAIMILSLFLFPMIHLECRKLDSHSIPSAAPILVTPVTTDWKRDRKLALHSIFAKFGQWDDLIISQLQAIFQLFSSYPPSREFCQVS